MTNRLNCLFKNPKVQKVFRFNFVTNYVIISKKSILQLLMTSELMFYRTIMKIKTWFHCTCIEFCPKNNTTCVCNRHHHNITTTKRRTDRTCCPLGDNDGTEWETGWGYIALCLLNRRNRSERWCCVCCRKTGGKFNLGLNFAEKKNLNRNWIKGQSFPFLHFLCIPMPLPVTLRGS